MEGEQEAVKYGDCFFIKTILFGIANARIGQVECRSRLSIDILCLIDAV